MSELKAKVEGQSELLEEHQAILKLHSEQIKTLQDNTVKLENVVMSENRETRLTITQTNRDLHDLINNLLGYKRDVTMARLESIAKIVGILAGSGGILYYIFSQ